MMVAVGTAMKLHGQAVLATHARQLGQQMALERLGFGQFKIASERSVEETARFGGGKAIGEWGQTAVVGSHAAQTAEVLSSLSQSIKETLIDEDIRRDEPLQRSQLIVPVWGLK